MSNTTDTTPVKPMAVLKRFFAPNASIGEMQEMIRGFKRPLAEDTDYVWLVNEAAAKLGVSVEWPSA